MAARRASWRFNTRSRRGPSPRRERRSLADVFVPDFGICGDVVAEQLLALVRGHVDHLHAALAQPVDAALERARLADHDRADLELHDESAAVPAGGERRDHDGVAVAALAPGL